jgi:hypothetical protein
MRFMMFVCSDSAPDDRAEQPGEIEAWLHDLESHGKRTDGDACGRWATRRLCACAAGKRW